MSGLGTWSRIGVSSVNLILDDNPSDHPDVLTKFVELGGTYFSPPNKLSKEELKEIYEKHPLASFIHQVKINEAWFVLVHNFAAFITGE